MTEAVRAMGGHVTRRGVVRSLAIAALAFAGLLGHAHEPDGRVAFRYAWLAPDASHARVLRLIVTPVVPLEDTQLAAAVPKSSSVAIRPTVLAGTPVAGAWPSSGLALGSMRAGEPLILDLEIAEPPSGGGTLSFRLTARSGEIEVNEGVGITVGLPGPAGTLRGDVLEFPAEQGGRAP